MVLRPVRSLVGVFALCVLFGAIAAAQSTGGAISGVVRDQTGPIPQAQVQIINAATGQSRFAATDDSGRYSISEVPPGYYNVRITASGYDPVEVGTSPDSLPVRVSVAQVSTLDTITLRPASVPIKVVVTAADLAMTDQATPTLSTSFTEKQISDLPIPNRDANNLALQAPGVFSVRTFSFASTLVPFAVNGSRGRDNNFIIDSVDNNEPLFGGAATQFTNTDLIAEYRILTNQYQAEYGRNSGSVINIITRQGGNQVHGSGFWFGQDDRMDAMSSVEKLAGLSNPAYYRENQAGGTLGGPIKKNSSWFFVSYQWDRARNDLSLVYPVVATLPTTQGLAKLNGLKSMSPSATLNALLADPTVNSVAALTAAPCGNVNSGLPTTNPCTVGSVPFRALPRGETCSDQPPPADCIPFGTYLIPNGNLFDVRDHQLSGRWDEKIGQRDTIYGRYLFDDLLTPETAFGSPSQTAFGDYGLLPQWRNEFAQRTQNAGLFWTHAWPTKLNELRLSYSRIASQDGPLFAMGAGLPALTIVDSSLAPSPGNGGTATATSNFRGDFPAAGQTITIGSDSSSTRIRSNIYQVQENVSITLPHHTLKFGVDIVRTMTDVNQMPGDQGHYFYTSFQKFVNNSANVAFQRFGNFRGKGGESLPIRELGQFYFLQDDIRVSSSFTFNLGGRYEIYTSAYNSITNHVSPSVSSALKNFPQLAEFGPRAGFAWGLDAKTVLRGGYGIYYDPIFFDITLLAWQSGPISPYIFNVPLGNTNGVPAGVYPPGLANAFPNMPFNGSAITPAIAAQTTQNTVTSNLSNPYIESWSVSLQRQWGKDFLTQVSYVGSKGTRLFQRLDLNPYSGWTAASSCTNPGPLCYGPRTNFPGHGDIAEVANTGYSNYKAFQFIATKRLRSAGFWKGVALTGAYTWSRMKDNASEIFGPGIVYLGTTSNNSDLSSVANGLSQPSTLEAITPFAQNPKDTGPGEYADSSFERRHRGAVSFLWDLPSPPSNLARAILGNWEFNGLFTAQSGQPFSPLNGFQACLDSNGDGVLTNDRPSIGNQNAPLNTVALLTTAGCTTPSGGLTAANYTVDPAAAHFVQVPVGLAAGQPFVVGPSTFFAGSAGRNSLVGPNTVDLDFAVNKNFPFGEHYNLQFRAEAYDLLNHQNPGYPFGNVFTANAQLSPAYAFGPTRTPARATGVTPENAIDATTPTGASSFLSTQFMNTSSRRIQLSVKFVF